MLAMWSRLIIGGWVILVTLLVAADSFAATVRFTEVTAATGYKAYVRLINQPFMIEVLVTSPDAVPGVLRALLSTAAPGSYEVGVSAFNSEGESVLSNILPFTIAGPTAVSTPTSTITSTPTVTTTRTATGTFTRTPTAIVGCNAGVGNLTCFGSGDQWTLQEERGQRIANINSIGVCGLSAMLYTTAPVVGLMHAELYADNAGVKGAKIGSNSLDVNLGILTNVPQAVLFPWAATVSLSGNFWIDIVATAGVGNVTWVSNTDGALCAGGAAFNAMWANGNTGTDFIYTIFVQPLATPTRTATNTNTNTVTTTPTVTRTNTSTATATATVIPTPIPPSLLEVIN